MKILNDSIIPLIGLDSFKFGDSLESVRIKLKYEKIAFNQCMGAKGEKKESTIKINNCITLYFIDDILFEIVLYNGFYGKLPNGIHVGMNMAEAKTIDDSLKYDDDAEGFISSEGYMIVDDIETDTVSEIEIFINEVLNDEEFYKYEWIEKLKNINVKNT